MNLDRYQRATSARVLSSGFNIAVGIRLLFPDDILGSSPGYRLMKEHFFGDHWLGLALLVMGVIMAASLRTDRWTQASVAATWFSLVTWLVIAIDIALVNLSQIGSIVYLLVAALNFYAYSHTVSWRQRERKRG